MSQEKLVRDGKVAVIVSPGYGAGWSTWADEHAEQALFSPEVAEYILAAEASGTEPDSEWAEEWALKTLGQGHFMFCGGFSSCRVEWVAEGDRFRIGEHDGFESLTLLDEDETIHTA